MRNRGTAYSLGQYNEVLTSFTRALPRALKGSNPKEVIRAFKGGEILERVIRQTLWLSATSEQGIVKAVSVNIGGWRTTDQLVADARRRGSYITDSNINQVNTPSGNGRGRVVVLEFFEFAGYDPTTLEVRKRCEEPGYGYSTYEDGLRFQEDHPKDLLERQHVIIPENPWRGEDGQERALLLSSNAGNLTFGLTLCGLQIEWHRDTIFARRRYLL